MKDMQKGSLFYDRHTDGCSYHPNQTGFGMIEIVCTVAIGAVVALAMTHLLVQQSRHMSVLQTKFAYMEIQRSIQGVLSNPSLCQTELAGQRIRMSGGVPTTSPVQFTVTDGTTVKKDVHLWGMQVKRVEFNNFQPYGPPAAGLQSFRSNLLVDVQPTSTTMPFRVANLSAVLQLQSNGVIAGCAAEVPYEMCDQPDKPENSSNKPCLAGVYRCPMQSSVDGHTDLEWASIGCVGHLSLESTCHNRGWAYSYGVTEDVECEPVGSTLVTADTPASAPIPAPTPSFSPPPCLPNCP